MKPLILKTVITHNLLQKTLYKSFCCALIGLIILLGTFFILPQHAFSVTGMMLFCGGIFLIGIGLLPYKRLQKLQIHPYTLLIDSEKILYFQKQKCVECLLWKEIESYYHKDDGLNYGFVFQMHNQSKRFIPYFTKRAFLELEEWKLEYVFN